MFKFEVHRALCKGDWLLQHVGGVLEAGKRLLSLSSLSHCFLGSTDFGLMRGMPTGCTNSVAKGRYPVEVEGGLLAGTK